MCLTDPVGAMVCTLTGRTLDHHAIDTHPGAAELPVIASIVRRTRRELMLTVDDLHHLFASGADTDAYRDPSTVLGLIAESLHVFLAQYLQSRALLDTLITEQAARRNSCPPPLAVQRRYVTAGEVVHVTLPHTLACRRLSIAGRNARVHIGELLAGILTTAGDLLVDHASAGVYRDPATSRLYVLDRTAA